MLKHLLDKSNVYMAPDGAEDGGGTTATAPVEETPTAAKALTEAEVNKREAALRRKYERQIAELEKKNQTTDAALAEIKAQMVAQPKEPEPSDVAGKLELVEKRWQRDREELQQRIAAAERKAEEERQRRLDMQREQALSDAIGGAGVTGGNAEVARRFFLPQVVWDEVDEGWVFKTRSGNHVSVQDGVLEEMPDTLKPSKLRNGGAGTSGGVPAARARKQKDLEDAEAELKRLLEAGSKQGGTQQVLVAYTQQKRKVEQLRRELASQK